MTSLDAATYISVSIKKHAVGNPDYHWVNTYEIDKGLIFFDYETVASSFAHDLAVAESEMHTTNVVYDSVTFSTWNADSEPYNPYGFVTVPLDDVIGKIIPIGSPLPRNVCLFVRREPVSGRTGKLFFRGALTENNVDGSTALGWSISPSSVAGINSSISLLTGGFNAALADVMPGAHWAMVGRPKGTTDVISRYVNGYTLAGVVINSPNHRYFDRAP